MLPLLLSLWLALFSPTAIPAGFGHEPFQLEEPETAEILSPSPGEALQGNVPIQIQTPVDTFESAELSFSYANDPTGSWFQIARATQPTTEGDFIEWDTTNLTDGNYTLRLTVFTTGEEPIVFVVPDLRIRNYTPIETNTPTPTELPSQEGLATPEIPPTATPIPPSPTPLPPNPAQIVSQDITQSLSQGLVGAVAAFAIIGVVLTIRKLFRR